MCVAAPLPKLIKMGKFSPAGSGNRLPARPGQSPRRQMVYNAELSVVVMNVEAAILDVRKLTEGQGGYLQKLDGNYMILRVSANKLAMIVDAVSKLGKITRKRIDCQDVTEEMVDLDIRHRQP